MEHPDTVSKYFLSTQRLGFSNWDRLDYIIALRLWLEAELVRTAEVHDSISPARVFMRFKRQLEFQLQYGVQLWPVFRLDTNEFVGSCGLQPCRRNTLSFELSVRIVPAHRMAQYQDEACMRVIEHAFTALDLDTLFMRHTARETLLMMHIYNMGFRYSHSEHLTPTMQFYWHTLEKDKWLAQRDTGDIN